MASVFFTCSVCRKSGNGVSRCKRCGNNEYHINKLSIKKGSKSIKGGMYIEGESGTELVTSIPIHAKSYDELSQSLCDVMAKNFALEMRIEELEGLLAAKYPPTSEI